MVTRDGCRCSRSRWFSGTRAMSSAEIRGSNSLMKSRSLPAIFLCFLLFTLRALAQSTNDSPQLERHFSAEVKIKINYDYLLFLPKGYGKSRQRWPLMLFLHGAGESGTNLLKIKKLGPPMLVRIPTAISPSSSFPRKARAMAGIPTPLMLC